MSLTLRLRAAVLTAALTGLTASAADKVVPAGGAPKQSAAPPAAVPAPVVPLAPCPPVPCPPGTFVPGMPGQPGMAPVVPLTPGTPAPMPAPGKPTTPGTPGTPPAPSTPSPPATPPAASTPPAPSSDALASATAGQGGGGSGGSALPGIFGDLFGGGGVPAPVIVQFDAAGRPIGQSANLIVNGRPLGGVPRPTDELLAGRSPAAPSNAPVAYTQVITSGISQQSLPLVPRIPTFNRGAFKITENETPRPTTRAYLTYNFYDYLFYSTGINTPRISLHQQMFGYEQAFSDQKYSIGVRLPYNQVTSPGYFADTSLGDITVVTKAVISENRATGDLLSGGLTITAPTGSLPQSSVVGVSAPRNTLLQPYLGYILVSGDAFLQGFSSFVIPTDSSDVLLYTQSLALGYSIYKRPGAALSGIYPVLETHLNTPLNHRDFATDPVAFPDTLTLLGGTFFEFYSRSTLGFAAGAPVTGPRPFNIQATCQLSIRF